MSLEATLTGLAPTIRQWRAWGRTEPVLAATSYRQFRRELKDGPRERADELLAALVRVAQHDPAGVDIVASCMWPGLCGLIRRHAPGLDRDEAESVAVAGLAVAVGRFPAFADPVPEWVASRLLVIPKRQLRTAVAREVDFRDRHVVGKFPGGLAVPGTWLTVPGILRHAVDAGVLSHPDAWLLWAVDDIGHSMGFAARRLGIGYQAACKRHQRASRHFTDWWGPDPESVPGATRRSA